MFTRHLFIVILSTFVLLGAGCQNSPVPAVQVQNNVNQPVVETPALNSVQLETPAAVVVPVKSVPAVTTNPAVVVVPTANKVVVIENFAFGPALLTVKKGAMVTWTNKDSAPHTVTSDGGTFASNTLANGQSFSFTFNQAGTFSYYCAVHPSMTATVVVTE